eukprot:569266-Lingulodinium_polyedra.AAC.1
MRIHPRTGLEQIKGYRHQRVPPNAARAIMHGHHATQISGDRSTPTRTDFSHPRSIRVLSSPLSPR